VRYVALVRRALCSALACELRVTLVLSLSAAAYLTACANEYALALGRAKPSALGMFSGIFFAAFQMSQVTGNFLESVVLPHTSRTVLFTTYLACAGVGLVCSAFLRRLLPPPSSYVHAIHSNTGPNRRSAQRGTRIGRLLDSNNGASLDSRDSHDVTTTGLTSGPASTGSGYGSGSESGSHSSAAISAARLPINSGLVHNPAGLVVSVRSLTSARGSCGGGVTPSSNGGGFVVHSNQHHGHALTQSTDSLVIPVTFGGDGSAFAPIPTTITPHSGDDSWDDVSLGLNTPPHSQQQLQPAPTRVSTTVTAASGASHGPRSTFFATLALWKDPRMLCLVPLMCLSGVEQGWSSGTFTRSYVAPSIGVENIGYVLAVYGLVNAAASGFVGKLSDCCGRVASLVLGFVSQGSVVAVLLFGSVDPASSMALVVSAGAWGLGDAVWNTQLYGECVCRMLQIWIIRSPCACVYWVFAPALLGDMFDTAIEPAFTNFKLVQSLLQGAAWVLGAQLGHHRNTYLYGLAGLLVASPLLAALAVHIHRSTRGAK